jgi:hypothetical protein
MSGKIAETRFTIQFSRTDPSHLHVAEILNRQGRRSKAQYIVNAILYYENGGKTSEVQRPAAPDEKIIEAIVTRILRDREGSDADKPAALSAPSGQPEKTPQPAEEISFDDALEALEEAGLHAAADTLEMFRRK